MNQISNRLISLDAFRGITIAGMILVNNPGSWEYVYRPLYMQNGMDGPLQILFFLSFYLL